MSRGAMDRPPLDAVVRATHVAVVEIRELLERRATPRDGALDHIDREELLKIARPEFPPNMAAHSFLGRLVETRSSRDERMRHEGREQVRAQVLDVLAGQASTLGRLLRSMIRTTGGAS